MFSPLTNSVACDRTQSKIRRTWRWSTYYHFLNSVCYQHGISVAGNSTYCVWSPFVNSVDHSGYREYLRWSLNALNERNVCQLSPRMCRVQPGVDYGIFSWAPRWTVLQLGRQGIIFHATRGTLRKTYIGRPGSPRGLLAFLRRLLWKNEPEAPKRTAITWVLRRTGYTVKMYVVGAYVEEELRIALALSTTVL